MATVQMESVLQSPRRVVDSVGASPVCDCAGETGGRMRRVLVLSGGFPSRVMPNYGVFVKERVKAVAALPGYEVRVIAPAPWFPPVRGFGRWSVWSEFPREEVVDGLSVLRPRYVVVPKVGHALQARSMYVSVRRAVERLRREWDFDVIDAHWAYPAGVVAVRLGKRLGKPAVITGRGEDMCRFPESRLVGPQIRWALANAAHAIGVSGEIAERMRANGSDLRRTTVIANGVDTEKFRPLPQEEARKKLRLPRGAKIILSVGDRFENKGFHLLIDALPRVRERHPDAMVAIVGGAPRFGTDFTPELERRIREHELGDHVRLVGARPHEELPWWYNAADVFALLSAREGSPNVLMEALACGTPAVGTAVGGIADVLQDSRLGLLTAERTVEAAGDGLLRALEREWDRGGIRTLVASRGWKLTAERVRGVFDAVLD